MFSIYSALSLKPLQVVRGIHTDFLLITETVKYFGGEDYERGRYASAINDYQSLEYKVTSSSIYFFLVVHVIRCLSSISVVECPEYPTSLNCRMSSIPVQWSCYSLVFTGVLGYLVGGLIVAYRVTHGQNSPSDFCHFCGISHAGTLAHTFWDFKGFADRILGSYFTPWTSLQADKHQLNRCRYVAHEHIQNARNHAIFQRGFWSFWTNPLK